MRLKLTAALAAGALIGLAAPVLAHHSFAMFDQEHPIELSGTVKEFKFTSPHTFVLLEVKGSDGSPTVWNLEGASPSALVREGWSSKTLRPGDELKMDHRSASLGRAWRLLVREENELLQRTADCHSLSHFCGSDHANLGGMHDFAIEAATAGTHCRCCGGDGQLGRLRPSLLCHVRR